MFGEYPHAPETFHGTFVPPKHAEYKFANVPTSVTFLLTSYATWRCSERMFGSVKAPRLSNVPVSWFGTTML